jgi:hypothetical protein
LVQVLWHWPVVGLQDWHGPQTFGTLHCPVAGLQLKQFGQTFGEQTPLAESQIWQAVHLGTHCPLTHFWHLSPLQVEQTPLLHVWHSAALHLGTQVLFWHFWQLSQVLTHCPAPLHVWHGPHLLWHWPPTHTWHWLVLQQFAPQTVVPTPQAEHTPLTQLPEEHSLPVVHCAPGLSVPGSWQVLRRSVPATWGSRQMGCTVWPLTTLVQQSLSFVQT